MSDPNGFRRVLVTGGAGYVGSGLVPRLLEDGYVVKVVDLFWYGREVFGECNDHPKLNLVELDIRCARRLHEELAGQDVVIHLACVSNDPSFEVDVECGKSINYEAFGPLLDAAVDRGVRRFLYASSSSVYGVQDLPDVTETTEPRPLTDYSRYKLRCERDLLAHRGANRIEKVILRPATVCGYSNRLRLDVVVNLLTAHALVKRRIRVFGGEQLRPNIHVSDMVRAYRTLLAAPPDSVDGEVFNFGYRNLTVDSIARLVQEVIGDPRIEVEHVPTDDTRSYHINSDRARVVLGFVPENTLEDAVQGLVEAFGDGRVTNPLTNDRYHNIKRMQALVAR